MIAAALLMQLSVMKVTHGPCWQFKARTQFRFFPKQLMHRLQISSTTRSQKLRSLGSIVFWLAPDTPEKTVSKFTSRSNLLKKSWMRFLEQAQVMGYFQRALLVAIHCDLRLACHFMVTK